MGISLHYLCYVLIAQTGDQKKIIDYLIKEKINEKLEAASKLADRLITWQMQGRGRMN